MNYILTILIFLIFNSAYSQETKFNTNTSVFIDGLSEITVCDSVCGIHKIIKNKDQDRIYLLSIFNCNGGKKLKGELVLELQKDGIIFYSPFETLINEKFNHDYNSILEAFREFNELEKIEFRNLEIKKNQNYYAEKREILELEEKKQELILSQKREEELRIIEDAKNEVIIKNKSKAQNDSILASESHIRLLREKDEDDNINKLISSIINKGIEGGGILLKKFNVIDEGYGRIGINVEVFNCSKKRIKYITFSVKAFNPVDDQVGEIEPLKGVGYIESNNVGEWNFDAVWYSDVISSAKITSIKLVYEDGSVKNISNIEAINIEQEPVTSEELSDYALLKELSLIKKTIIGSVQIVYIKEDKFLTFYDLYSGEKFSIQVDDLISIDLGLIINDLKSGSKISQRGIFETNEFSNNIYIKFYNGTTTVINLQEAIQLEKTLTAK